MKKKDEDEQVTDALGNVVNVWDNTLAKVVSIFEDKKEDAYPEGVLLFGSIIEELLGVLITHRLVFSGTGYRDLGNRDKKEMEHYCDNMSLYNKIRTSFILRLIDKDTYKALEEFRDKRNKWVHDYFLEKERPDPKEIYNIGSTIMDNISPKLKYYMTKM